ncbi:toxin lethal factor, N-and C-terminal domain [Gillisia sp. Hel1_33_143]|uniref:DUF4296 domain-containing protein n=1 Tax=Gillisia sp. Hel1_33_143 TaxID=1336796 RepID=UPI00087BC005|nr:DUF4296 domain-containing protein [Gillisia sp. Hel1_33_143]SDR74255.1 toxin lethal factor, N-and C-terminal domain [Gillisia sp. Hel1_33_143]
MKYLVLLVALLLVSCQSVDKTKKPDNLIPEGKMVEVLTDLVLLNSAKNYNRRILEETGIHINPYIYEKHGIDSLQLAQSTQYYAENTSKLDKIYKSIKDSLEVRKSVLEKIEEEEVRVQDSIREASVKDLQDSLKKQDKKADSLLKIKNQDPQVSSPVRSSSQN